MEKTFTVSHDMLASQGQRLLHYVLDTIIVYGIIFALGVFIALLSGIMQSTVMLDWIDGMGNLESYMIFFTVSLLYYGLMETFASRTVSKFITKTIVVMEDGTKPDGMTILRRTFCRLIPFDGFSYLGDSRGWHDTIPDVFFVKKAEFEKSRELFHAFEEIGETSVLEL